MYIYIHTYIHTHTYTYTHTRTHTRMNLLVIEDSSGKRILFSKNIRSACTKQM